MTLDASAVQTGMRGAFGKPQGVCARVAIGQILLSIRCKDVHNAQVCPVFGSVSFTAPYGSLQAISCCCASFALSLHTQKRCLDWHDLAAAQLCLLTK